MKKSERSKIIHQAVDDITVVSSHLGLIKEGLKKLEPTPMTDMCDEANKILLKLAEHLQTMNTDKDG